MTGFDHREASLDDVLTFHLMPAPYGGQTAMYRAAIFLARWLAYHPEQKEEMRRAIACYPRNHLGIAWMFHDIMAKV
jgi:hypothetical protein